MKLYIVVCIGTLMSVAAHGADELADTTYYTQGGLLGLSLTTEAERGFGARRVLDQQSEQTTNGGELSQSVYVRTLERVSDSFDDPIARNIAESSRGE